MSTDLHFYFPFGRYHATPWDRAANDGSVEWPPAPWRILRTLYAVWANHELERTDDISEEQMLHLLDRLAVAPSMVVAPVDQAHTRHYMPGSQHRTTNRSAGTDRVIDSFAVVPAAKGSNPRAALKVSWPVDLDESERQCLSKAAGCIGYLGRAESICWAELSSTDQPFPEVAGERRWAPQSRSADERGQEGALRSANGEREASVMTDGYVADVAEASLLTPDVDAGFKPQNLLATIASVRLADKRAMPVGSRFLRYRSQIAEQPPRTRTLGRASSDRVTTLRWVLDPSTRPSATLALLYGEFLRSRCKKILETAESTKADVHLITGHVATDRRPAEGHRHAHFLFLDEDGDGLIDHATLWVPQGLLPASAAALLARVTAVGSDDRGPARKADLRFLSAGGLETVLPWMIAPSSVWATNTPYCVPRFQKRETIEEFVAGALRRDLVSRGIDTPFVVDAIADQRAAPDSRFPMRDVPLRFRRTRLKRGGPQQNGHERGHTARNPFAVRLEFVEAVEGPLLLGQYSHFGLGVFFPGAVGGT